MYCPKCGLKQPEDHRYCPSCGTRLPAGASGTRPKVSRWFWSVPVSPADPPRAALRVSCYLEEFEMESGGDSVRVPSDHVRFSIWVDDQVVCALSIPNGEAEQLVEFLQASLPPAPADPMSGSISAAG